MNLFNDSAIAMLIAIISAEVVFFTAFGIMMKVITWVERRHPEVFKKFYPRYLEDEDELY